MENFELPSNVEDPLKNEEMQEAPQGWETLGHLAKKLDADRPMVNRIANRYIVSNPEYFKEFKAKNGIFQYYSPELIAIIEPEINKFKETSEAPEGWMTKGLLYKSLKTGENEVAAIANIYRNTNPEYFGSYRIPKIGRVEEYLSPELVEIIKREISNIHEIPFTPEGWKTLTNLSGELGTRSKIAAFANQYKESNPEYFKKFRVKGGPVREHYSPELVTLIEKEIANFNAITEKAPEEWKPLTWVHKKLGISPQFTSKLADKYREDHPEYFKLFKTDQGPIHEYYSPELVNLVTKDYQKIDKVTDGWNNRSNLSRRLEISDSVVSKIVEKYRHSSPQYFKTMKLEKGGFAEHYSPELIKIIEDEINKFKETPEAPEGWMTRGKLYTILDVSDKTIRITANKYREDHPEYFRNFRSKSGILEYYSPELIEEISKETKKISEAPEGWKTATTLSDELNASSEKIYSIVSKYRQSNPEYFEVHRGKNGGIYEHFSPELVNIIDEEIKKQTQNTPESPESWLSLQDIIKKTGVSKEEAERIAKRIRQEHQGQFGKFKSKE